MLQDFENSLFMPLLVLMVYAGAFYTLLWMARYLVTSHWDQIRAFLTRARILWHRIPLHKDRRRHNRQVLHPVVNPDLRLPEFWIRYTQTAIVVILVALVLLGLLLQAIN